MLKKTKLHPFTIGDETVYFTGLTLGARTKVQRAQSALMFGEEMITPGDAANLQRDRKIPIADVLSSGDRQTAAVLAEVVRNEDGSPYFASATDVMDCDAVDVDTLIAEYNRLYPQPITPTVEQIKAEAGNSAATG
jgi:hypothetical protein